MDFNPKRMLGWLGVTMSIRRMTLGSGYRYLMSSVARADSGGPTTSPLTVYYTQAGTPPGRFLGRGLAGVEISSFAGDVELSDPRLEPFWARAAELRAVVFLHPFGCSLDERLDRFYLANTVGQPAENAVALSHLIFAGVLDRHPDLKIVAAHGGGYLPTAIGRSDRAWKVRPEARRCEHAPSTYLRKIWFDTVVHDPHALRTLVEVAGGSQVVLGSDYPFDLGSPDPVAAVGEAQLDPRARALIEGGTAAAFLGL